MRRDGTFEATAPLPPANIRTTSRARYEARIGRQRSMRLEARAADAVTSMRSRGGTVTIAGRWSQPLTTPVETIVVKRRVTVPHWKVVKRFRPRSDGSFRVPPAARPRRRRWRLTAWRPRVKLYSLVPRRRTRRSRSREEDVDLG